MRSLTNNPTCCKSDLSSNDLFSSTRPSPCAGAEAIKHRYTSRLDKLLTAYQRDIAASLSDADFSPAYKAGEVDGYLHRLDGVMRAHKRKTFDRVAAAEKKAQK